MNKALMTLPLTNEQNVARVNAIITVLAPRLMELTEILKTLGMSTFDIMVGEGRDKISWNSGVITKTPTQDELAIEVTHILDNAYPENVTRFMGMVWSQNKMVAEKIAEIIAEYRKRDRSQIESQIIALLAAFKQSN